MIEVRIVKRDSKGYPIEGQYESFGSESAAEVCDWYEKKTVFSRPGKRHHKVASKKSKDKRREENDNNDVQLRDRVG